MSGASGSTGTIERPSPPSPKRIPKRRPHGAAFSFCGRLLRSALTRRAPQQLGHLFFQRVQGIGGPCGLGEFGWRLARGLGGDGRGCRRDPFALRRQGARLISLALISLALFSLALFSLGLFGCGALKGATEFKAPGRASGAVFRPGRLHRRRLGRRLCRSLGQDGLGSDRLGRRRLGGGSWRRRGG